ncbi:SpaH/EbpB family LPXTG-anchored major pilin [Pseudoclavibacter sp. CFCC 11306]|uniref:SpaH/EbpB family LPXTG-anchored major pilin n=1 Tax=Pseudoclavibacter sp. CFCC 11306 TaxID=1564493 RepID=UPI0013015888|nr:SpaH/EbpB family LPXTG-anchored major pilin [Pseudoclavibacter sp. CFCC 11306]KAB1658844.1 LPXTG cell wall anchor domain-containing protein [Pseudoclavibacter sp. CFCC 11306]
MTMSSLNLQGERRSRVGFALLMIVGLVAATLSLVTPAHASGEPRTSDIDPNAQTHLVIHKFEQPQEFGLPTDGLPLSDSSGYRSISGVQFSATRVPGIDLTTDAGWTAAKTLNTAEAAQLIAGESAAGAGATGSDGTLTLDLGVGLYYVQETHAPAGVVAADPFLVAMPLQHPTLDQWMYTVHVYPKNPRVGVSLTDIDANAVTIGDTVSWTSTSDVPRTESLDGYAVQNLIAEGLELSDAADQVQVALTGTGAPALTGDDFETQIITVNGRPTVQVTFTESGRAKLTQARATDPQVQVAITYHTTVLTEGAHTNEVRLLPDNRAIAGQTAAVTAQTTTKFGYLQINVHEKGNPSNLIPGAKFKVYLSADDAANDRNAIVVDGTDEWTTNDRGQITLEGFRLSNFVNGLDRDTSDPLYRSFFVKPTFYPAGWMGDWNVQQTAITSVDDPAVTTFEVWRDDTNDGGKTPPNTPGQPGADDGIPGFLARTGAQLTGLVLLGIVLIGGGALALVRRRRKPDDTKKATAAAESREASDDE